VQRLLLVVPVIVWAHLVGSKQRRPRVVRPQAQDGRGRHPVVRGGTPLPAPPRRPRHDATGRHAAPADAVAFDWSGDTAAFGTAVSADLATQPGRRASGTAMGRAVAAFVDEALSSLQNFVIMFAALRYLPVRTLGWFTVAYTAALFFKALLRALLLEPLSIRFAGEDRGTLRRAGARAAGASLATGTACLVVVALLGLALRGEARSITVAVALCLPMLITQEAWRVYFFAAARSWRAVVNDGLCFVGTLALLVLYVVSGAGVSAAGLMVLWAVGIGIGVVWGIVQSRAWPLLGQAWHWLREQWDLGSRLAAARGAERAANQVVNILVVAIAGSLALGQLSASRTIVAPVTTALMATGTFAVPEAVRLYRRRDPRLKILIPAISLSLGGLVAAAGLAVYFAPGDVGSVIAGENWEVARSLFIPTLLWVVAIALRQGPLAGLRVYQRAKTVLYLSTSTAAVLVVAVAVAAALDGARGAAWAFAVVFFVSSAVSWVCYRRATAAVWRSERGSLSER
jgi:O-antigen/teichoic acid export membrane protein